MVGDRLQQLARRIVREETYSTIVAPAIADLQFEAPFGWPSRVRAYAGAWRALLAATVQEITHDCVATSRAVRMRSDLRAVATTLVCLTGLMSAPMIWVGAQSSDAPWHHEALLFMFLLPTALTFSLPAGALPLAAAYARTGAPGGRRAGFIIASAVVVVLSIGNHALRQRTAALHQELIIASSWGLQRSELRDRPLWEVRQALRKEFPRPVPRQPWLGRGNHTLYMMMLMGLTYAMCGIAASRQTHVRLPLMAVALFVTHGMLTVAFSRVLHLQGVTGYAVVVGAPAALLLLASALVVLRTSETRA
jgi:hypothetical protein